MQWQLWPLQSLLQHTCCDRPTPVQGAVPWTLARSLRPGPWGQARTLGQQQRACRPVVLIAPPPPVPASLASETLMALVMKAEHVGRGSQVELTLTTFPLSWRLLPGQQRLH